MHAQEGLYEYVRRRPPPARQGDNSEEDHAVGTAATGLLALTAELNTSPHALDGIGLWLLCKLTYRTK